MANRTHAKSGQTIYILDTNGADDFLDVKEQYYVVEVLEEDDENSKCFRLLDVPLSWWARPECYEIVSEEEFLLKEARRRYPKGTHYLEIGSRYFGSKHVSSASDIRIFDRNPKGPRIMVDAGRGVVYQDEVWAPIVDSGYQDFQEGDTVVRWRDVEDWEWNEIGYISLVPIGKEYKVSSFESGSVLNKVPSIEINGCGWYPATAFTFSKYYNQSQTNRGTAEHLNESDHGKSKISTGISIEVQGSVASIISGQRRAGSRIQGRRDGAIIGRGHLSHKTITGK